MINQAKWTSQYQDNFRGRASCMPHNAPIVGRRLHAWQHRGVSVPVCGSTWWSASASLLRIQSVSSRTGRPRTAVRARSGCVSLPGALSRRDDCEKQVDHASCRNRGREARVRVRHGRVRPARGISTPTVFFSGPFRTVVFLHLFYHDLNCNRVSLESTCVFRIVFSLQPREKADFRTESHVLRVLIRLPGCS